MIQKEWITFLIKQEDNIFSEYKRTRWKNKQPGRRPIYISSEYSRTHWKRYADKFIKNGFSKKVVENSNEIISSITFEMTMV